jgi:outer membrane receptor protein involved in Fe transport
MRILIILFAFISFSIASFAQNGKIEGAVVDGKSNKKISGVSVQVVETKQTVATNVDGQFVLTLEANKKYSISVSSVGYQPKVLEDVEVKANEVTNLEIILEAAAKTESEVVVRSSSRKETTNALIAYQKNTAVVAQVVSAEAIRRSPDKNTGEVLKRVPGTSVQEGKYLVVRGLADRYNQAMLNGVLLSSTEPDRKTFSFDILPSSMIDNIIINKAFIPELPGEWAGGLIQVNTKDVPAKNFFSVQIGTGFNTQTIGKDFYSYAGSNTDFLGFDNGLRALPENFPRKAVFAQLDNGEKTAYGKVFTNTWTAEKANSTFAPALNQSLLINGGFNKKLGGKNKLAGIFALNYNRSNKRIIFENQVNLFQDNVASINFDYDNEKYAKEVLGGALGNITLQLGNNHKISFKNILNVNTTNYTTLRTGKDYETNSGVGDNIKASELAFKANTFFNTQLTGDHDLKNWDAKFHWFGSFNILDQYIPDQRRIQYNQDDPTNPNSPYSLLIGASKSSQKSGSRYYGFLNDYVYTTGADVSKTIKWKDLAQTIKAGYFFQVKDRLFDSRPFAIYLPSDNPALRHLPADKIFAAENFGDGFDNKLAFNELSGTSYRYIANSILNAGFLQFDNQFTDRFRAVWGVRVENFDQVVGSMNKNDTRHVHSKVTDYLPGANLTYKVNNKTNVRLSGSQTVVRPEFRELSTFQFFDFDLGATVAGNTALKRTKISNFDLRYEIYPGAGELFTVGVFYKYFKNPIEAYFNVGAGGSSTYNFINADEANSFGAEFEFRKKLDFDPAFKNFTVQGNISYIYNRVTSTSTDLNRPMQGQSPYLFNAGLQYDIAKHGITSTLLFNQIGRRIVFVGGSDQPPIWENPRPVLDFQLTKKILKTKGELKMNVADIFNRMAVFYTDLDDNKKYDSKTDAFAIRRNYGTNLSFSFNYNF